MELQALLVRVSRAVWLSFIYFGDEVRREFQTQKRIQNRVSLLKVTHLVVGHSGRFIKTSSRVKADHTMLAHTKYLILSNVKQLEWDIGQNGRTGRIVQRRDLRTDQWTSRILKRFLDP